MVSCKFFEILKKRKHCSNLIVRMLKAETFEFLGVIFCKKTTSKTTSLPWKKTKSEVLVFLEKLLN